MPYLFALGGAGHVHEALSRTAMGALDSNAKSFLKKDRCFACSIKTSAGIFRAFYTENGLVKLEFPSKTGHSKHGNKPAIPQKISAWHSLTTKAVRKILEGLPADSLPPLDISSGTEFQLRVWRALMAIPCGKTRTYGQIAEALGMPRAARAVGRACGANPIPLLIPCHRVLACNNLLGGFSAGLEWKQRLLAAEGIRLKK